jgi:hypothetical protein
MQRFNARSRKRQATAIVTSLKVAFGAVFWKGEGGIR